VYNEPDFQTQAKIENPKEDDVDLGMKPTIGLSEKVIS